MPHPDPSRPGDLVASIVALSEQTTALALSSALEAAQADALGKSLVLVEAVCRLAVSAGVAAGEVAWCAEALDAAGASSDELGEAAVAVASLQGALLSVAFAIRDLADSGGPLEIRSAAEALSRAGLELEDVLARLEPVPALDRS